MKIAVVTGATSGMGEEFVRLIDRRIHGVDEIWVFGRRKERLMILQEKVNGKLRFFDGDLSKEETIERFQKALEKEKPIIRILVNSAGFGKLGKTEEIPIEDSVGMIDVNCRALTMMTICCIPYLGVGSRVIQIASSAAFLPQPGFNVYAATKAYVLSFSRALRNELQERKIYVTAVCPGPVATEFFDIAEENAKRPFYKKIFLADTKKVVEQAMMDSMKKKEVSVYGSSMKLFRMITKIIPKSLLLRICRIIL